MLTDGKESLFMAADFSSKKKGWIPDILGSLQRVRRMDCLPMNLEVAEGC